MSILDFRFNPINLDNIYLDKDVVRHHYDVFQKGRESGECIIFSSFVTRKHVPHFVEVFSEEVT